MADLNDRIRAFWSLFARMAEALGVARSADDATYDLLLCKLQEIHPELFLEFSLNSPHELIVTAEGRRELFPLAYRVVAAAPAIDGWTIRALRQKLGFPQRVRWNDFTIELRTVCFEPLESAESVGLGIRLLVPGLLPEDAEDAHNALLRAIDHGLGEQRFAESVEYTEIAAMPGNAEADDLLPLVELDHFLDWRDRKPSA